MSEQLLNILKLCLLALVYLFLVRVVRAVWAEVAVPKPADVARRGVLRSRGAPAPTVTTSLPAPPKGRKARGAATELVAVEPAESAGRRYPLGDEITVGRAAGCQVTVDDTYVSQLHARVFSRDGQIFVEDLGSTNGTYLNRAKVAGPMVMHKGDRLQIGNTVLEVR
jgi:pSer/pThr/pTyr-binding forkhead associated (FHA) protein